MKAGILAAGSGSRFLQAGWEEPKPLIRFKDEPIIHHVLRGLFHAGVDDVEVMLNGDKRFDPVEAYLLGLPESATSIRVCRKITHSSFETFACLLKQMGPPPFVVGTVDSILDPDDLREFLNPSAYPPECSLSLAVTDYVHDEKPLWVALGNSGEILAMGDDVEDRRYATAGMYLVLQDLGLPAGGGNFPALRYFLKYLLQSGKTLWSKHFRMALDIDDPGDLRVGEELLLRKREDAARSTNTVVDGL